MRKNTNRELKKEELDAIFSGYIYQIKTEPEITLNHANPNEGNLKKVCNFIIGGKVQNIAAIIERFYCGNQED